MRAAPTTIVAGIDEAGYGPHIGPLVVAASAFALSDGVREAELHRLVDDQDARRTGLPVADSKRLYRSLGTARATEGPAGQAPLAALEISALGHVALARGVLPVTLGGLLAGAIDLTSEELDELPWYAGALLDEPLPAACDPGQLLARAATHRTRLAALGLRCAGVFLAPVPVPRFNRLTNAAGSKAFALFRATGRLIETLIAAFPGQPLVIHVDRQGGRIHYGDLLQTFFPLAPLTTHHERVAESSYRLDVPRRPPVSVTFRVKADGSRAPVAVASAAAKLVREVFLRRLCAWFSRQQPGLRPSAGYGTDGRRFVDEVAPLLAARGLDRALLVRCR